MYCYASEPSILSLATCCLCDVLPETAWISGYKTTKEHAVVFCSSRILWNRECWLGCTRACFHLAINKLISLSLAVERENLNIILKSRMIFFPCWYVGEERTITFLQNISKGFMQHSQTLRKNQKGLHCKFILRFLLWGTIDLTMSRFPHLV